MCYVCYTMSVTPDYILSIYIKISCLCVDLWMDQVTSPEKTGSGDVKTEKTKKRQKLQKKLKTNKKNKKAKKLKKLKKR